MTVAHDIVDRISRLEKRLSRFRQFFNDFGEGARRLVNDNAPHDGIRVAPLEDGMLIVLFASMRLSFVLLVCYGEDGAPRGRVVCTRQIPAISDKNELLGSFTFSAQGVTDLEVAPGRDQLEIGYHAPEIIMHFVDLAIRRPLVESRD